MYVPQAKQLTHGGFFSRSGDSSLWDTPEVAKLLMHYLVAAHPERAAQVTSPASGRTLQQLVQDALAASEAGVVVDAFLEVKQTVAAAENAMVGALCSPEVPFRADAVRAARLRDYCCMGGGGG